MADVQICVPVPCSPVVEFHLRIPDHFLTSNEVLQTSWSLWLEPELKITRFDETSELHAAAGPMTCSWRCKLCYLGLHECRQKTSKFGIICFFVVFLGSDTS